MRPSLRSLRSFGTWVSTLLNESFPPHTEELQGLAPDEGDDDDVNEVFTGVPASHDYLPYGNKTV